MSPHYFSARDGNETTIPQDYRQKDYKAPSFKINKKKAKAAITRVLVSKIKILLIYLFTARMRSPSKIFVITFFFAFLLLCSFVKNSVKVSKSFGKKVGYLFCFCG